LQLKLVCPCGNKDLKHSLRWSQTNENAAALALNQQFKLLPTMSLLSSHIPLDCISIDTSSALLYFMGQQQVGSFNQSFYCLNFKLKFKFPIQYYLELSALCHLQLMGFTLGAISGIVKQS